MAVKRNEMSFLHSRIIVSKTLLLSFCASVVQLSAGTECGSDECRIQRIATPEYVTAFYDHRPALTGCVSRERSSPTNQEVHVVLVRGSGAQAASGVGSTVDVMVKHTSQYSGREKAVFVLASTRPTVWRIHFEHSSNESRGLFLVSKNSTVSHDRHVKLKMRKQELPLESQKLMAWARKKWTVVTSLVEAELASVVTIRVGDDPSATEKCEILSRLPNVYVLHIEIQEVRGCVATWNEDRDRMDVHVIELLSPTVENVGDGHVDVAIEIRSRLRPVKSRHVVLVLKSHVRVHWHVTTRNLRGTLDIITDQVVESNGTNTQSFRVAVEPLTAYSGQELINWTCDKYGVPASYTEAHIANRLSLVVDGRGSSQSSRPAPTAGTTPSHSRHHLAFGVNDLADEMTILRFAIIRSMHIECSEDHLLLIIQKAALAYRNHLVHGVSFQDVACAANSNRTHFALYTESRSCGTSNKTTHDSVALFNAIVIEWRSKRESGNTSSSDSGDAVSDPVHITINISCDYPIAVAPKEVQTSASLDIQFRLRLFRDVTYREEMRTFPAAVEEREAVFIQANIAADICIQINVQNCSLEADDTAAVKSQPLIVNGCIVDESVQWVQVDGDGSRQSRHFQMRLRRFGDRNYNVNFRCELAVCTVCQSSLITSIPLCKSRENHCGGWNATGRDQHLVASVSSGPLMLVLHSTPGHHLDRVSSGPGENANIPGAVQGEEEEPRQKPSCEPIVRVDGLSMEIVISIAFAAFIIGILLMASLWYIYVRTAPGNIRNKSGMQSASNSGDSTPSSTAPITVHQVATSHR